MKNLFKQVLNNKIYGNISWILIGKVLQAFVSLVSSSLMLRYLGPSKYGVITYSISLVAFVMPIIYFGVNNIIVHEILLKEDKIGENLGSSIAIGLISSIFCVIGLYLFVSFANKNETQIIITLLIYSISLFIQAFEIIQYWFQANYYSKYTSIVFVFSTIIVSILRIVFIITSKNIYWFALTYVLDHLFIIIGLLYYYNKLKGDKFKVSFKTMGSLISSGKYYVFSSLMVTVFSQTDKIMLKHLINEEATGLYSAAVGCAGTFSFVISAIIDTLRPFVFQNKNKSNEEYEKSVSFLYGIIFYLSLLISFIIVLFSKPIILIVCGNEYVKSIGILRLVVWYTCFSYIGSVRNVWILAEKKQKYLWILNLFGASVNVFINFLLIPKFGIIGAAIASIFTEFFTNFIMNYFIISIRRCNRLFLRGLNPVFLYRMFKNI